MSETNRAWEGTLSFDQELSVKWVPFKPMLDNEMGRSEHVSVVLDDKLFSIGGPFETSTEQSTFDTNEWKKGPVLPFRLSRDQCVLNKSTRQCFILGGRNWDRNEYLKKFIYLTQQKA